MTAYIQPGGETKHPKRTRTVRILINRYRASRTLGHVVNFAKGVLIGGIVVLFISLMVA